jgi:hypothetical protein
MIPVPMHSVVTVASATATDDAVVIMACGGGKSMRGAAVVAGLSAGNLNIAAPVFENLDVVVSRRDPYGFDVVLQYCGLCEAHGPTTYVGRSGDPRTPRKEQVDIYLCDSGHMVAADPARRPAPHAPRRAPGTLS